MLHWCFLYVTTFTYTDKIIKNIWMARNEIAYEKSSLCYFLAGYHFRSAQSQTPEKQEEWHSKQRRSARGKQWQQHGTPIRPHFWSTQAPSAPHPLCSSTSPSWLHRFEIQKPSSEFRGMNAFHVLLYLRKQSQALPRTKGWDFTVHFPSCEAFVLASHSFRKAQQVLHSMEYDWNLKISINTTPTSEAGFRWQFPFIFMTKKKKHSPNIIFRNDTT